MKTILIDQNMKEAFRYMDPFEYMDRLSEPKSFAIGVVFQYSDGDEPVGLLVCTEENDRLVIQWLFVDSDYRENGVGSYLLILAFEEAKGRGLSEVAVRISDEIGWDDPSIDTWGFFDNGIFTSVEEGEKEARVTMSELTKKLRTDSAINEKAAESKDVRALSSLSRQEMNEAISTLKKLYSNSMDIPIEDAFAVSDKDMSFVKKTGDDYTGMALMKKSGHNWYQFSLNTKKSEDDELLLRTALFHFEDSVQLRDEISIEIKKKSLDNLLDEISLPVKKYDINYLVAQINDYEKRKKTFSNSAA